MSVGYPSERVRFNEGRVGNPMPSEAPEQLALMRLDTDWYESTKHGLVHFYGRISQGRVIIIDDYGTWSGSRRATDDIAEQGSCSCARMRWSATRSMWTPNGMA
jgi:hypothetical protein